MKNCQWRRLGLLRFWGRVVAGSSPVIRSCGCSSMVEHDHTSIACSLAIYNYGGEGKGYFGYGGFDSYELVFTDKFRFPSRLFPINSYDGEGEGYFDVSKIHGMTPSPTVPHKTLVAKAGDTSV